MTRNERRRSALGLAGAMTCLVLGLVVACDGDDDSAPPGAGGSAAHAGSGGAAASSGKGGNAGSSGSSKIGAAGKGGAGGKGAAVGSAGTNAGQAGGGVGGGTESGCEPVLTNGVDTGTEHCTDGTVRRRAAKRCPLPPPTTADANQCGTCTGSQCCEADSDCPPGGSDGPVGICANAHHLSGLCGCFSGCFEDADCAPGSVCECGSVFGACVPATCQLNRDCGPNLHCVLSASAQFSGGAGSGDGGEGGRSPCVWGNPPIFACETASDECRTNLDCGDGDCVVLDGKHVCIRECPI